MKPPRRKITPNAFSRAVGRALRRAAKAARKTANKKLKYSPATSYASTEHGAVTVARFLNSRRAVEVSIYVVRAFMKLREMLGTHSALAQKLAKLERTVASHDGHTRTLFEAIRRLTSLTALDGGAGMERSNIAGAPNRRPTTCRRATAFRRFVEAFEEHAANSTNRIAVPDHRMMAELECPLFRRRGYSYLIPSAMLCLAVHRAGR